VRPCRDARRVQPGRPSSSFAKKSKPMIRSGDNCRNVY
jgi:hypothetical protein